MIFHILGPSGSGKTTLGKKLAKKCKNTIVLDTDDIDDENALKLLKKYDVSIKKEQKQFLKERKSLNKIELDKFLEKNKNKNIIFVGFDFGGMEKISKLADHKFSIKIDHDILFRQYNLRTLDYITKNKKEIKSLLENDKISIDNIFEIITLKFKIRNGFKCVDGPFLYHEIVRRKQEAKDKNYKYKTSDEIFEEILNIISKNK